MGAICSSDWLLPTFSTQGPPSFQGFCTDAIHGVFSPLFCCLFICFEIRLQYVALLVWNSLSRPGCPQTDSNLLYICLWGARVTGVRHQPNLSQLIILSSTCRFTSFGFLLYFSLAPHSHQLESSDGSLMDQLEVTGFFHPKA